MIPKRRLIICSITLFLFIQLSGCKKISETPSSLIVTTAISHITQSAVTLSGTISHDEGVAITEKGFCTGLSPNPSVTGEKVEVANDSVSYTKTISGFSPNVTYYVRSYAINSAGVTYGNELTFTLWINLPGPIVMDIDGNTYRTVKIGTQVWMAENLRTTKYRNGDLIGTTTPDTLDIRTESTPKYQWTFKGYESQVATYGKLYTQYALNDTRNIAPTGWHVATDAEWATLVGYLGGGISAAGKLREAGTKHWNSPTGGATNESGFTALSCGYRAENGFFYNYFGFRGFWWSSTLAGSTSDNAIGNDWILDSLMPVVHNGDIARLGLSVRCVKD